MSITVQCQCGRSYEISDDKAGWRFRCQTCDALVDVPSAGSGGSDNPFAAPSGPSVRVSGPPIDVPNLPLGLGWWAYAWMRGFDFEGRSRRREYWFFQLYNAVINIAITITFLGLGMVANLDADAVELMTNLLSGVFGLASFIPGLAVAFRRLHDINKSGWWLLLYLLCCIGPIILLVWAFFDSDPETNEWGPSPKYAGGSLE